MPTCSFCKKDYNFPRGITVVQKEGTPRYFCSSKCRKNSEMGRDNRKVKWVKKVKKSEKVEKAEKIEKAEKSEKVEKAEESKKE